MLYNHCDSWIAWVLLFPSASSAALLSSWAVVVCVLEEGEVRELASRLDSREMQKG